MFLVGSLPELGNWSPDRAIPLVYATLPDPMWMGEYSNWGTCCHLALLMVLVY